MYFENCFGEKGLLDPARFLKCVPLFREICIKKLGAMRCTLKTFCLTGKDPAGVYLLEVNNRNTRTRCEICSVLTIMAPERRQCSNVSIVNFEHAIAGWRFVTLLY